MQKIYKPRNEVELSFIKSILDSESIPYFVHKKEKGDHISNTNYPVFSCGSSSYAG